MSMRNKRKETMNALPFPHNIRCGCFFAQILRIGTKSKINWALFVCYPVFTWSTSVKDAYKHSQHDEHVMCSHWHFRKEWIISIRLFFRFSHQINKLEKNEVLAHSQQQHEVSKYNIFITKHTFFSTISILFPTYFSFFFFHA